MPTRCTWLGTGTGTAVLPVEISGSVPGACCTTKNSFTCPHFRPSCPSVIPMPGLGVNSSTTDILFHVPYHGRRTLSAERRKKRTQTSDAGTHTNPPPRVVQVGSCSFCRSFVSSTTRTKPTHRRFFRPHVRGEPAAASWFQEGIVPGHPWHSCVDCCKIGQKWEDGPLRHTIVT